MQLLILGSIYTVLPQTQAKGEEGQPATALIAAVMQLQALAQYGVIWG